MTDKPWKIEYKDELWVSVMNGKSGTGTGFFVITFEGIRYGSISKAAWDAKKTKEILQFVEQMMNDAHELALQKEMNK